MPWQTPASPKPENWNMAGWTWVRGPCQYAANRPACTDIYYSAGGNSTTSCLDGQATSPQNCSQPAPGVVPNNVNHMILWEKYDPPVLLPQKRVKWLFTRPAGVTTEPYYEPGNAGRNSPQKGYYGRPAGRGMPRWQPSVDPLPIPPHQPMPVPHPIPYDMIPHFGKNPNRSRTEQTERGHEYNPRPRARPIGRNQPPKGRTKEKKIKGAIPKAVFKLIGGFTEWLDFMNAMYKALPSQYKQGYYELHYYNKQTGQIETYWKKRWNPSQTQRMEDVWNHVDKIPLDRAFEEWASNQISDVAWATIGNTAGGAGQPVGNTGRGWTTGPWDTVGQDVIYDAANHYRDFHRGDIEDDEDTPYDKYKTPDKIGEAADQIAGTVTDWVFGRDAVGD